MWSQGARREKVIPREKREEGRGEIVIQWNVRKQEESRGARKKDNRHSCNLWFGGGEPPEPPLWRPSRKRWQDLKTWLHPWSKKKEGAKKIFSDCGKGTAAACKGRGA